MSASKAQRAKAAERRARAISLRIAGMDWAKIAETVGYRSAGAAYTAVNEALKLALKDQDARASELRALTVMRYDRLQAAFWADALRGDPKAADVVLKCIAGRARIEGTEAPTRVNVDAQALGDEIIAILDRAAGSGGPGG